MAPVSFVVSKFRGLLSRLKHEWQVLSLRGDAVECNLCGYRARRFASDAWHPHTICPRCGSQVRHRLLVAAMKNLKEFSFDSLVKGRRVLHFAPEPVLRHLIEPAAATYTAADFLAEGYSYKIDLKADISHMPEVADGSCDLVIACDVLEHVPDDRAALREVRRVLAAGGQAILTVPQKDNADTTEEDPTITDPRERERRFGQSDHVRIYGADFIQRCVEAGFRVDAVDEKNFSEDQCRRHVLIPPILSAHPLATNFRKIFFLR